MKRFFNLLSLFVFLMASSNFGWAQVTGAISGKIEDPSGAAIPAASVTVTSLETGAARTVTADEAGLYRVLSLPVGQYEIKAEKAGFAAALQKGINLAVGQQAVVNLKLQVGAVQQEVTVMGEAPLVNTTTASVSGLVGERQVKDLPLNGRSFDNLITLNAGAISYTSQKSGGISGAASGSGAGNFFTVSGRRPTENLFLLNGVEYTGASDVAVTPGGASGQLLGIDAVREFNVVSDTYSAEYGKRAGGQVSIVTQSGSNQIHGTAFEFLRNSQLDARNFFDQGPVPPFKRNQFGGAAGGPIQKDKTFIFGSYEGFRQRLGLSSVAFVPDQNARRGLLPNAAGAPTPVAGLDTRMLPYMAFWPEANGPELGGGVALAYSNPKQSIREDFGTVRLDHTFSVKDSLSGVYTVDDGYNLTPIADPVFGAINALRPQVASVQETHVFSPNVINSFTAGVSRAGFLYATPPIAPFPSGLSFWQGAAPGAMVIGAGSATGASAITSAGSNGPLFTSARTLFTYQDGVQVVKGNHQISAGVWFEQLRENDYGPARLYGQASFGSLQSFLQGTLSSFTGVPPNAVPLGWRQLEGAWYLQDAVQLRPNLSVRFGLRHEFTNGWNEATGRAANFITDSNGVLLTNTRVGNSVLTENNAKWLFSPRVGLAWDPFGKGKTSIRAGVGTYYDLSDALDFELKNEPPFNGTISFASVPFFSIVPLDPRVPSPLACGPGVPQPCTVYSPQGVQSSMKTPTVEEWNFAVEQQITTNTALRAAYVGSHGTHSLINIDSNAIHSQICSSPAGCTSGGVGSARGTVPQGAEYIPVGTRPNPYLSNAFFWYTEGNSSYNALQLEVTERLSKGLQFRANYTWSKDMDMGSGLSSSQSTNQPQQVLSPYHPQRDRGPSALDIRNQAKISGAYELPFGHNKPWPSGGSGVADKLASGWQVNWIATILGGFPFTPQVGSNRSGDGNARNPDRPSVNPAFSGPVILGSPNQWFNPNAYILPVPGTYGNLGRGTLRGPGLGAMDISLFKNTAVAERIRLEFRAECFNILNHANFGSPNPTVFIGSAISPTAGIVSSTTTTSRQIQFGLKLIF